MPTLVLLAQASTLLYQLAIFPPDTTNPTQTIPLATLGVYAAADLLCDLAPGTPVPNPIVVTPTTTLHVEWDDPLHPGRTCRLPGPPVPVPRVLPRCAAAPCPQYPVLVGAWSTPAQPTLTVAPATGTECTAPLGAEAVALFVTRVDTGRPGARALVQFQLASKSPVTAIRVRLDGVVQPKPVRATDASQIGSVWFRVPASGTHRLTVEATNAYGCSQERAAAPLVVP